MTGSWPTVTMASPMTADSSPLIQDRDANEQMMVRPRNTRLKRSAERNCNARSASLGAMRNRQSALKSPPQKLADTAMPSARPAWPLATSG